MCTIDEIKDDFGVYGIQIEDHDIVNKCYQLCDQYNLTGEQIAVCWLGYSAKAGFSSLSVEGLEALERKEFDKKAKKIKIGDSTTPFKSRQELYPLGEHGDADILAAYGASPASCSTKNDTSIECTPSTSQPPRAKRGLQTTFQNPPSLGIPVTQSPGTPSQKYSRRSNKGNVVASFGVDGGKEEWVANLAYKPKIMEIACGGDNPLTTPYRSMFEKLRDCAEYLDEEIAHLATQMMEMLNIEEESHICVSSNVTQWFIGRICCDSVGRLNSASVLLEGSRAVSRGQVVPVDLSEMESYSLFPGQVVAIKGVNSTGRKIVAQNVVAGRVLPTSSLIASPENETLQMVIASGPFTTSDNLLFEPLDDLLKNIYNDPPNILILLGPLLDANHSSLEDMLVDSFDNVVNRCIEKIKEALGKCGTEVMIVSSPKDVSNLPIYPTPPMRLGSNSSSGKIRMLADPSMLFIDGVTIALTSNDVLMQISKEEISYPPHLGDRMARLAEHLLLQQSFFPLYPPPEGFCLSLEHASEHSSLPFTPDFMVLPSDFRGFVKDIKGCVVINPEHLSKGQGGGSYARMEFKGSSRSAADTRVQILKI